MSFQFSKPKRNRLNQKKRLELLARRLKERLARKRK